MKKRQKTGGRKKGKPNKVTQEIREIVQSSVDFTVLVNKMFELVKGLEVVGDDKNEDTTYIQPPNVNAAKLLLEYGFGKPKEVIELDAGENATEIVKIFSEMVSNAGTGSAT